MTYLRPGPDSLFGAVPSQLDAALHAVSPRQVRLWYDGDQITEDNSVVLAAFDQVFTGTPATNGFLVRGFQDYHRFVPPPRAALAGPQWGEYPHLIHNTVAFSFPTSITQLATATTIGGATTRALGAQTITVPEVLERVFSTSRIECTFRTEFAATNAVTLVRLTFQLGSGPVFTKDVYVAAAFTASHNSFIKVDMDITDYMNQNFSGTSMSGNLTVSVASTVAANVNNITGRIVNTYGCNVQNATRAKCIRIPIQSQTTSLTNAFQEIGTDGNSPAPSGQIPALDTFLPELGAGGGAHTILQATLCLYGNDGISGATTITPQVQIDALSAITRATIDSTILPGVIYYDQIDLTATLSGVTNVTHTVNMIDDSVATGHMCWTGGWLEVSYTYDHPATISNNVAIYEAFVPVCGSDELSPGNDVYDSLDNISGAAPVGIFNSQTLIASLDIQEPGTIAIKQSAVIAVSNVSSSAGLSYKSAGQQPIRAYTPFSSMGPVPIVHRVDINNGWTLQRGLNRLTFNIYSGSGRTTTQQCWAIINYTAGIDRDVAYGNHPVNFQGSTLPPQLGNGQDAMFNDVGIRQIQLGLPYKLTNVLIETWMTGSTAPSSATFSIDQKQGEWDQGNFILKQPVWDDSVKMQSSPAFWPASPIFNRDNLHTGKCDITKRRRHGLVWNTGASVAALWSWWITYQQHAFAVAGTLTVNGAAVADGTAVEIWAQDPTSITAPADLVTTVATTGGTGAFTCNVPDNTRNYFASYVSGSQAGRSPYGTPGVSSFSIAVNTSFGGSSGISRGQMVNA